MAKQKGPLQVQGKLGNKVFTHGVDGESNVRQAPVKASETQKAAARPQNDRTIAINKILSPINTAAKYYARGFPTKFYRRMHTAARVPKSDVRIVVLDSLLNIEVHPLHTFNENGTQVSATVVSNASTLTIKAEVISHMKWDFKDTNCYNIQMILVLWDKAGDDKHYILKSDWIFEKDGLPLEIDFPFARKKDSTDYVVLCRCEPGQNKKPHEFIETQCMNILLSGSLDAKAVKSLAKHQAAVIKAKKEALKMKRPVVKEVRMKVRGKCEEINDESLGE